MKRILVTLSLLLPFFTGCTNIDTTVKINVDKSAVITSSLEYEGDLNGKSGDAKVILGIYKDFLDPNYTAETDFNVDKSTISAVKTIKNIDKEDIDLSSLGFIPISDDGKFLSIKKNFFAKIYLFGAAYDYSKAVKKVDDFKKVQAEELKSMSETSVLTAEYLKKYADPAEVQIDESEREDFSSNLDDSAKKFAQEDVQEAKDLNVSDTTDNNVDISFKLTMPVPLANTNADFILGNTYIWNIEKDRPAVIKVQYTEYNGFAILFVILVGILFFVYVARRVMRHDTLKRIENNDVPKLTPNNKE